MSTPAQISWGIYVFSRGTPDINWYSINNVCVPQLIFVGVQLITESYRLTELRRNYVSPLSQGTICIGNTKGWWWWYYYL